MMLIVLVAILYVGVAAPLFDLYDQRVATLADYGLLEPRLRAAAAQVPIMQVRLTELQQVANTRKITLDGASDALASAIF